MLNGLRRIVAGVGNQGSGFESLPKQNLRYKFMKRLDWRSQVVWRFFFNSHLQLVGHLPLMPFSSGDRGPYASVSWSQK